LDNIPEERRSHSDIKLLVFSLLESKMNIILSVVLYMFTKYGEIDVFLRCELLGRVIGPIRKQHAAFQALGCAVD
jgi:hypothetical protein